MILSIRIILISRSGKSSPTVALVDRRSSLVFRRYTSWASVSELVTAHFPVPLRAGAVGLRANQLFVSKGMPPRAVPAQLIPPSRKT